MCMGAGLYAHALSRAMYALVHLAVILWFHIEATGFHCEKIWSDCYPEWWDSTEMSLLGINLSSL